VMFVVNNKEDNYANWTLWTITWVQTNWQFVNMVKIKTDDWNILEISKKIWNNIQWEDEFWEPIILWSFLQFPFKIAFAMTIHKCQGKSFKHIVIDLWRGAWEYWQVYTWISRSRSYEWVQFVKKLKASDIKVDKTVINFLK
jgi:ATP-dependent exoDNAse (exonuclease V) alpha subunit